MLIFKGTNPPEYERYNRDRGEGDIPENARQATPEEVRAIESGDPLTWDRDGTVVTKNESQLKREHEEAERQAGRTERDKLLRESDPLMLADRKFTRKQRKKIKLYRQALRDWPEAEGFPDQEKMPKLELPQ